MDEILDLTRRFIKEKLEPNISEWEERKWFPSSIFKQLAEAGISGILIPEEFGGLGLNKSQTLTWCEVFGETPSLGFTVGCAMSFIVCAYAILSYGSEEQRRKYLPAIAGGEKIFAYAFTEPEAGTDLRRISTNTKKVDCKFFINGEKIFITNGVRADNILVFARDGEGFSIFIVDKSQIKSVSKLDKLGWHSSDTAILTFSDSEAELLGTKREQGWEQVLLSLSFERLVLTALGIGLVKRAILMTEDFAETRIIKGETLKNKPLFKQQTFRSKLELNFISKLIQVAVNRNDIVFCTGLKAYSCDRLFWIVDQLLQFHGGYGYTTDYLIERIWRDMRLLSIGGGSREPLWEYVYRKASAKNSKN